MYKILCIETPGELGLCNLFDTSFIWVISADMGENLTLLEDQTVS